jgi:hypothetical protein
VKVIRFTIFPYNQNPWNHQKQLFGPSRNDVTAGWRKLHNEELRDLHSSPSIIRVIKLRRMRLVGHVARMGEKRNMYRLLVGKPGGKRPI